LGSRAAVARAFFDRRGAKQEEDDRSSTRCALPCDRAPSSRGRGATEPHAREALLPLRRTRQRRTKSPRFVPRKSRQRMRVQRGLLPRALRRGHGWKSALGSSTPRERIPRVLPPSRCESAHSNRRQPGHNTPSQCVVVVRCRRLIESAPMRSTRAAFAGSRSLHPRSRSSIRANLHM